MVAYSFKARFAEPILLGAKAGTIRADRKRHARPGEQLQLYTGMRTRHCRLLVRTACTAVVPVRLSFHRQFGPGVFVVDGERLTASEMDAFAVADGFADVLDMSAFWLAEHPPAAGDALDFSGVQIRWQPVSDVAALEEWRAAA
ncbi:hypothetical protein [Methylobacterium oryzihabitans]|uniref:ASCH domain-containing protein n=1 Tax=Methylobacterium oryzihabitans TaxID=2499852 RepID=A0A437NYT8_9HYPH|nr:hypothetical protein [Methylobacterium oryzihabitans]RVU15202.1 hypothetical protein EOE48_20555 [Methylobacterium oryzihabitans]